MRFRPWPIAAAVLVVALVTGAATPPTVTAPIEDPSAPTATAPSAVSAEKPLVIVLDLSGSMNDTDAAGVSKIAAAKTSVERILRTQGLKGDTGVWVYPGAGGCDPGGFAIEPTRIIDVNGAAQTVDALAADGDTPTGEALQAVKQELVDAGYSEASIVLVSDGESTCDTPPCEVAAGLADAGFAVTVDAVGFQQSAAGRDELECVANAAGGRYFDAENGDELIGRLDELSSAHLAVDVAYPRDVKSGTATDLTVTVTNTSAVDASDIRVNLSYRNNGESYIMPAVLPPTYLVGNIPAGKSVNRTWTVSTGVLGQDAVASFRVTAWGPDTAAVQAEGTYTMSGATVGTEDYGNILREALDHDQPVVILGDSFSAGEGTFDYLPEPNSDNDDVCHRSMKTYFASGVDDEDLDLVKVIACSGAVTSDFRFPQHPGTGSGGVRSQLDQLNEVTGAGAALLTIGGNDIGFADTIKLCIAPFSCAPVVETLTTSSATGVKAIVQDIYQKVWDEINEPDDLAARNGRYAPVIVLPYPQILHDASKGPCWFFESSEIAAANRLVATLNTSIERAAAGARANGYEVHVAAPVHTTFLPEHTYCSAEEDLYVNRIPVTIDGKATTTSVPIPSTHLEVEINLDADTLSEAIHPNVKGYAAETVRLALWSQTVERVKPDPAKIEKYRQQCERDFATTITNTGTIHFDQSNLNTANAARVAASCGTAIHINFKADPGSIQTFILHSTPTLLGTAVADEDGNVDAKLWIPDDVEPGAHELVATGVTVDGEMTESTIRVDIIRRAPAWVLWVAAGAVLALAGAIALTVIGLVRRRRTSVAAGITKAATK